MDVDTRLLHQSLIRLLKGVIAAYERWLNVRLGKEPMAVELPPLPPQCHKTGVGQSPTL
jgi:hypothetical protein